VPKRTPRAAVTILQPSTPELCWRGVTGYSAPTLTTMLRTLQQPLDFRAILLALLALSMTSAVALAEDSAAPSTASDTEHWTAYGYNITAPASMWPMRPVLTHAEQRQSLVGAPGLQASKSPRRSWPTS
jgi:hypothetical protein